MIAKVMLPHVNDAALFAAKCGEYGCEINCRCEQYVVDAKSLMGLLSIGLGKEFTIEFLTDDEFSKEKFIKDIKIWEVVNESRD